MYISVSSAIDDLDVCLRLVPVVNKSSGVIVINVSKLCGVLVIFFH